MARPPHRGVAPRPVRQRHAFLFAETCAATHNKCRSLSSGAVVSRAWQVAERHTAWHGGRYADLHHAMP